MAVQASDEQLITSVSLKDIRALEALYERYEQPAYSFALQALGDRAEAEQAVAEAFRRVWQQASGYNLGQGRFALWLYHLAQAAVSERWRLRRRRQPGAAGNVTTVTLLSRQLRRALSGLPPELVQVVELAYFHGYTQAEIADLVGITPAAVRARLTEAFDQLRGTLARNELKPPAPGEHALDSGLAAVYSLNLLPAAAARQFEAHLAECERCRAEFAGFQAVGEILFHAVPLSDPPLSLKAQVLEQVERSALTGPAAPPEPLARTETAAAAEPDRPATLPSQPLRPIVPGVAPARVATGRRPRPVREFNPNLLPWPESGAPVPPPAAAEPAPEPTAAAAEPAPEPTAAAHETVPEAVPAELGSAPPLSEPLAEAPEAPPATTPDRAHFRPAPLRAPVANPIAPHRVMPAGAPPELPGTEAPAAAPPFGEGQESGVAVARPRRRRDAEADAARRQALFGELSGGVPAREEAPLPPAVEATAQRRATAARLRTYLLWSLFCFLAVLAAAMTYSAYSLWQRVGDLESLAVSRAAALQKAEADLTARQPSAQTTPVASLVIPLLPVPNSGLTALGEAVFLSTPEDKHVQVQAVGLPVLKSGEGVYHLWVVQRGGTVASAGVLDPDGRGYHVTTAYYAPEEYAEVYITREPAAAAVTPQGQPLLRGTIG